MATAKKKKRILFKLDSPLIVWFSLIAIGIFILDQTVLRGLCNALFLCPSSPKGTIAFNAKNALDYVRLFTHVLGHTDWAHLLSNLSFILLLGPVMEERYGSRMLLLMMCVASFVTGVLTVCFVPLGTMGANEIAFMLVLLSAFGTIQKQEIPVSVVLLLSLYVAKEILTNNSANGFAEAAHLAGGICGSLFALIPSVPNKRKPRAPKPSTQSEQREPTATE